MPKNDTTGGLFEARLLGQINAKNSPAYRILFADNSRSKTVLPHKSFKAAMEEVKQLQPWGDITDTEDKAGGELVFPRELIMAIEDELEIDPFEDKERVKYYTAVANDRLKTALDVYHGIDAFLEYTDANGQKRVVTLDATTNPRKVQEGSKADFIITEADEDAGKVGVDGGVVYLPDPGAKKSDGTYEINDEFLGVVETLAQRISRRFRDPLEQMQEQRRAIR